MDVCVTACRMLINLKLWSPCRLRRSTVAACSMFHVTSNHLQALPAPVTWLCLGDISSWRPSTTPQTHHHKDDAVLVQQDLLVLRGHRAGLGQQDILHLLLRLQPPALHWRSGGRSGGILFASVLPHLHAGQPSAAVHADHHTAVSQRYELLHLQPDHRRHVLHPQLPVRRLRANDGNVDAGQLGLQNDFLREVCLGVQDVLGWWMC